MPTYEYLCDNCNYQFEEFQNITAAPIEKCPKCNSKVHRLISSGNGLIFKGSGFYVTDYKKTNNGLEQKSRPAQKNESADNKKTSEEKK